MEVRGWQVDTTDGAYQNYLDLLTVQKKLRRVT